MKWAGSSTFFDQLCNAMNLKTFSDFQIKLVEAAGIEPAVMPAW
jgi:hypothetical protein